MKRSQEAWHTGVGDMEKVLEEEHLETLTSMGNLALSNRYRLFIM